MEKRILAIGIVSLFLITGLTTISATQLPGSAITIPQKNIPRPANVNHTTVEMIITDGHAEKTLFLTIFRPPVHKFFTAVFMTGGTITIKDLTGKIIEEYHLT
ncbi:MAG: hypothetical protein NTZ75_08305, partial [Euryarchaeota archaeon]|nr:hypothetical protein [Euryarchaeota archaeon]